MSEKSPTRKTDRPTDDLEPPCHEFVGRVVTDDGGIVLFVTLSSADPGHYDDAERLADAQVDALAESLPEGMALVDARGEEVDGDA